MNTLVRLIYASQLAKDCGPKDVEAIIKISRVKNAKAQITGALCYDPRYFLQCFEGPRDAVNDLYRKIAVDPRHRQVSLIEFSEISERDFADWVMAYVRAADVSHNLVLKYSHARHFDPFLMSASQARAFLKSMIAERRQFLEEQRAEIERRDALRRARA